ncbi:nitrogen permease regulator 2 [Microthyrium microscopicum]|uniref:Nitrogen permease regulator 2 n=1 Tax=Microthyrium microscopicum TaxID=703497 RepID=A0A6A6U2T6_9PEZI|nr:nitrogen permease regulator 2 [Microthyrium microscopicum]
MSMIKAIFFARFHPEKGPRVLHQVPEGAIVPGHDISDEQSTLFDFSSVSPLIIPGQEFCDRLITVCTNHYRIIGFPVCVEHSRYFRNQFIFNFCLVLEDDAEFSGYVTIVRKLATLFRNLEEQSMFLSKEENDELWEAVTSNDTAIDDSISEDTKVSQKSPHFVLGGKIYALREMIFEDLNNYCECMIPIDDSNTINLKIFPTRPPPPPIYAWHVPLSTVQLAHLANSSDLTLSRIIPHIDGIASVAQIAQLADTDLHLTRKAIAHLLYYNCVILLDIFQYAAIYAPTADFGVFVDDSAAQDEALRYVCVGQYRRLTDSEIGGGATSGERWAWRSNESGLDRARLVELYAGLQQGLTLKSWCLRNTAMLLGLDVRRFITFGVIKGFLYRVHKYVVLDGSASIENARPKDITSKVVNWRDLKRRGSDSSDTADLSLGRYLDGMHCFDEICTELQLSEKKVLEKLKMKHKSNIVIIHR